MYKEGIKYKLIGYKPVGIGYNEPREEIAEWKNGYWYPYGCGKRIVNFVIEQVVELSEYNNLTVAEIRDQKLKELGI